MRLVFPAFCNRCYQWKVADEDRWVTMTADNGLSLGDRAAATNIWGYWAGKWGMPGRRPQSYFHSKIPDQPISWSLRAYPDGTLQWGDNAWDFAEDAPHISAEDMLFHGAAREEAGDLVPSECLIGVCASSSTFENCTYIGASGDRLLLMPADRALTFQWRCESCESRPLNGSSAVLMAGLVGLALLPLGLYRAWRSRRKLPPPTQWPAAPRSSLAWIVFFISWGLVIIGLTPSILWYVGHWWASQASTPMALVVLGAAGMQMCLRQDDPLFLIRLVSLLNVLLRLLLSWFIITEMSLLSSRIFDAASGDAGDSDEIRDYPLSTPFGRYAVDSVFFTGTIVLQSLIIVFCVSQIPLWCPGAKRGQPQPLRWLWYTMRIHIFASAVVLFLMSLAYLVIGFSYRETAYPAEVQRGNGLLNLSLTMGTGLLVSTLVTNESSRFRIHLRSIRQWRSIAITRRPLPPNLRSTTEMTTAMDGSPSSGAAPHVSSHEAILMAAPPGMANAPQPSAEASNRFEMSNLFEPSQWSNVDVSAWRDPDGRFDSVRLLSRIGDGGYASVFVAQLDKPLILTGGVAVGGVADASSSAGANPGHSSGFRIAVKVFNRQAYKDAAEVRRMHMELELALSLVNPYVVRTLGTTVLSGFCPALVMELMAGSLADLIRPVKRPSDAVAVAPPHENAALSPREISGALKRRILLEVALGLEFLHSVGVVHRDIKPANVLVGSELHAKISDFGIATRFGMETLTADIGTARYMAPEVVWGPYDERADIFAFGMLVWETLHQAVAFGEMKGIVAVLNVQRGVRPPHKLPEDLANLVPLMERCWQQMPQERPQRMSEVIETLEDCGAVLSDEVVV